MRISRDAFLYALEAHSAYAVEAVQEYHSFRIRIYCFGCFLSLERFDPSFRVEGCCPET